MFMWTWEENAGLDCFSPSASVGLDVGAVDTCDALESVTSVLDRVSDFLPTFPCVLAVCKRETSQWDPTVAALVENEMGSYPDGSKSSYICPHSSPDL